MLKASELRIGNWVQVEKWDVFSQHASLCFYRVTGQDLAYIDEGTDEVDPILLSSEWLSTAGFQRESLQGNFFVWKKMISNSSGLYHLLLQPSLDVHSVGFYWQEGALPAQRIRFVHQLQNLYYLLSGEELTIARAATY